MSEQDKLRNTLRKYYDNQEAPYSENEWERASAYLKAARRKRRVKYSILIFTALFSSLFTIINYPAFFSNEKHNASFAPKQRLNSTSISKRISNSAILPRIVSPPSIIKTEENSGGGNSFRQSTDASISLSKTRKATSEENADLAPAVKPHEPVNDAHSEIAVTNDPPVAAATVDNIADTDKNGQEAVIPVTPADTEESADNSTSIISPVAIENSAANDNKDEEKVVSKNSVDSEDKIEITPVSTENPGHAQNELPAGEIPQAPMDLLTKTEERNVLNDGEAETPAKPITLLNEFKETEHRAFVDTFRHAEIEDTTMMDDRWDNQPLPSTRLAGEGIFYEVGAAWLNGWKGPVHRDARGFSPIVSINYMNRITNRCSISFGLQYLQVSNLSNSSKTSRISSYVYGEQSTVTMITPSSLYYLVAPLRFHYYADRKNSFGAGINLAYLMNVEASVTSYDEKPGSNENYKTKKLSGYTDGFSWFDSQLTFSYRRIIAGSFGLQAEIFIGLTDVKQDEFFGFKNKERNSGAKLSLIYYAFRKHTR